MSLCTEALRLARQIGNKSSNAETSLELAFAHDVSRGCAHAFAAYGHIRVVQRQIDEHAEQHHTHTPAMNRSKR